MTEGGGGSEKVKISVTSFMNGPLYVPLSILFNETENSIKNVCFYQHQENPVNIKQTTRQPTSNNNIDFNLYVLFLLPI